MSHTYWCHSRPKSWVHYIALPFHFPPHCVMASHRITVGDSSFATAGPRIWNTLPRDVTSATSLLSFRRKHTYFGSHILTLLCDLRHSGPCSFYFGDYK